MPRLREPPRQEEEEKPVVTAGAEQVDEQPEVVVAPQDDGAAEELKKQIETLRKSEQAARDREAKALADREQAIQYARQREAELIRSRKETGDSRLEAIQNGIAAATAEAEEAKRALRSATMEQDLDAQIEAQERLSEAKANLINLTNGKTMLESQIQQAEEQAKLNAQRQQQNQQNQQGDALDRTNLPPTAKTWLRAHPEYLSDPRKNAKIQSLHWDVLDEGHAAFSDAYYESLEQHLGLRSKPQARQIVAEEDDGDEEPTRTIVSAPVSRDVPSGNRQQTNPKEIRLTASQKEAAKMAGITEVEYAKQLIALNKAKANGSYGGQP